MCCWSAMVLIAGLSATPALAERQDGLSVRLDPRGRVVSVTTGGKSWPLSSQGGSGLLIRDVAAGGTFQAAEGDIALHNSTIVQSGTHETLGLQFEAVYRRRPNAIDVTGFVRDVSGRDRAVTVRFALPIDATGGFWWPDIAGREQIADQLYANHRSTRVGATGKSSRYPWGAVSAEPGELCLSVPMDHFVVHRIEYDGQAKSFYVEFDFGLSRLTKAFPSRADFRLVIFTADPKWGFRSAAAKYYTLFPEAFKRRAEKEGLWMPFTDVAKVENPENFNFVFQEGAPNVPYDDAHGIYSFKYISPHWAWLWMPDRKEKPTPEFIKQKLADDLKSDDAAVRKRAQLIVNCAPLNADGNYHYNVGRAHWAPSNHGPVGWYVMYPANADPELEKLDKGPTTGSETMAAVEWHIARFDKPGAFLDGFYFDGVDARPMDNYAQEHFAFASSPLTFGTKTKRPILCGAFCSYKFVKRVAERMHTTGRMTMANGVPAQFPFVAAYLDAGGSELEPSIESDPVRPGFLPLARTLLYQKPLLLLYKPRLEERFDRDLSPHLVDYMHSCLPYAAEPSLFKIFSRTNEEFYHSFFARPDWYNKYRPIFIEYVPLVRDLALAGWEPVTCARAGNERMTVERFGTGAGFYLVVYNPLHEEKPVALELDVELAALGWPEKKSPVVANLLEAALVPVVGDSQSAKLQLALPPRRSAVLAFRPKRSQLAVFDLNEAVRYAGIASGRLADKLAQEVPVDFDNDPDQDGVPVGYTKYREGSVKYASDTDVCHTAPRATKVVLQDKARATLSTSVPVEPGQKYRFAFWGKAVFPSPGSVHF